MVKESTALGAAIYAGVGAGLYDDAGPTAERLVQTERIVEAVLSSAEAYQELYERWRGLYGATLQLSETGLVRPLWRAAGT